MHEHAGSRQVQCRCPVPVRAKEKAGRARLFQLVQQYGLFGIGRCGVAVRAINQFDQCHRRIVAIAETVFQDAQVTAGAGLVTRTQFAEQLDDHVAVAQTVERQAVISQVGSLPRVISGSTKRRSSWAFGCVVL